MRVRPILQDGRARARLTRELNRLDAIVHDSKLLSPDQRDRAHAALCAVDWRAKGAASRFRGFEAIAALTYTSTTAAETVCKWCPINCTRTFIDVQLPGAQGRPWSKLPLAKGWERVISGNSCPKGLVEDVNELREVKSKLEEVKREYPNVAEMVRTDAFRRPRVESAAAAG